MASTINTYFVLPELRQFLADRGVMNDKLSSVLQELERNPAKLASAKGKTKGGRKSPAKSGYNIYQKEYYPKMKAEHPEMSSAEIITHISSTWKARSDEFKAEFNERAAALKREQAESDGSSSGADSGADSGAETKPTKAKKPAKAKKPEAEESADEEAVPSDEEEHDEFNDEFNF